MRNKQSLALIIRQKVIPKTLGILAAVSGCLIVIAVVFMQLTLKEKHLHQLNDFNHSVINTLNGAKQKVKELAGNDLIINHRHTHSNKENYLPILFRSIKLSQDDVGAIVFIDSSGTVIAGKNLTLFAKVRDKFNWRSTIFNKAIPFVSHNVDGMFIAYPVFYENSPQAAIAAFIPNTFSSFSNPLNQELTLWLDDRNSVVYSSNSDVISAGQLYQSDQFNFWYQVSNTIDGKKLASLEPLPSAYKNLIWLVILIIVTVIGIFIGTVLSIKISVGHTAKALEELQYSINDAARMTLNITAINDEPVEFESIRTSYNQLLDSLSNTTVSLDRFDGVINSLSELLLVVNLSGHTIMHNESFDNFCKSVDYSLPQDLLKIIPKAYLNVSHAGEYFEHKYHHCYEITDPFSDSFCIVRWSRHYYCDNNGDHIGYVFVGADVTQARSLEEELLLKNKAIDEAQTSIVIADALKPNNPISYVNSAFIKLTGYEEHEVIGRNCRFLQGRKTDKDDKLAIKRAIEHKHPLTLTILNYKKDGTPFYNELNINPIFNEEGQVTHFLGLQTDVTERENTSKYLNEAKRKAEESAQLKSEFLASMSHEIRTPMNGVLGMLGLLMNSKLSPEQSHQALLAKTSADSLLVIINDILDFSKIEAGKLDLENIKFDLTAQIGELAESVAPKAQEKGLELLLDLSAINSPMVSGDPGRLRQILNNLIGNAIKFTANGEIVVRAKLIPEGKEHCRLHCSVSDTGVGIKSAKLATIFESFTQEDTSTTREFGGTGLGLSITQQLCKLMQGSIEVTSQINQGSYFTFEVLFAAVEQSKKALPSANIVKSHILIVDDNAIGREVLQCQLESWGAKVIGVQTPEEALDEMKKQHFNVVFIDMHMPNTTGAQLGEQIRAKPLYDKCALILMTTINQRGDASYFSKIGFNAYFPKPTTVEDLYKALHVVLDGGDAMKQADPLVTRHYLNELSTHDSNEVNESDDVITMLLVDDNRTNRFLATTLLKSLGGEVTCAVNGKEALETLKKQDNDKPFAIVFMDCQMPEMDGYEATARIRSGEAGASYQHVPIIAMTANAMKGDKDKCLSAGMDDYISKPINVGVLKSKVRDWKRVNSK